MKRPSLFSLYLLNLFALCAMLFVPHVHAAAGDWNYAYGMGNPSDDWLFSGCGVPFSVVQSVHSNASYYITSPKSSGAPRIETIWLRTDLGAGTLKLYGSTNTWTCASNQPAGTNIVWLTETNSAMATNDILVYRSVAGDSYQMLIVSGNATDYAGTVYTNASGQVGIKVFNTPTNAIVAGDLLYKMSVVNSFTPLAMGIVTNQINNVVGDHFGQLLRLGSKEMPLSFRGPQGVPLMVVMTYSNSGVIHLVGDYYVRQRR